jgi:putative ABC transport system ATP-binding protein
VSALELRGVVKHYGDGSQTVRAVDGVTLTIQAPEMVALCGPSGSGKSTLMMMAASLIAPDEGSIRFDGREVGRFSQDESTNYLRHDVGYVSQAFSLTPVASALDNAIIGLGPLGFTRKEARAKTMPWLERVGLAGRASHRPEQLSTGEQQRVAIARALVSEPGLLLADEPTGNLDSKGSRQIFELLREICTDRGIPGLLVTHDPNAFEFVNRVYTLRDGRLLDEVPAAGPTSSAP